MLFRCLANLCPRYSNMVLLFFFFKYEDSSCHCSRKADVTKLNAPKNSIGKTNILCSTRRLKLIMQRVVLSSFLLWKKTSRISGIKSISRGIQCSHHCFGLTCLQCGRVGRFSSGPRAEGAGGHVGSYVLNAAATPWRRGAGFPQAFTHCWCVSKRFWFPPQPPYQKRVQLWVGALKCHLRTNLAQVPSCLGSWQMSTAGESAGLGRTTTCSTC